jgi:hypothetical protein
MLDHEQIRGEGTGGYKSTTQNPTTLSEKFELSAATVIDWLQFLLLCLALLLIAYFLWRRRYRLGLGLSLGLAHLLARSHPLRSMQLSAWSLKWSLRVQGHPQQPGHSIREYVSTARGVPPLAKKWMGYAVEDYCAVRFGGAVATPALAHRMRESVRGSYEVANGLMPELRK